MNEEFGLGNRIAAKLNATWIGRGLATVFGPVVRFLKWCAIIFLIGIAAAWLFVPTFRYGVQRIDGPGPQPTDCDFMTAPLGNKGCHYELQRVVLDHDGNYVATVNWFNSRTDGKPDDPNAKPDTMVCTWEKVQD